MAKRVFDVTDETYSAPEASAERAQHFMKLQRTRRARNQRLLKAWRRRLKRAQREVRKRERTEAYYAKVLPKVTTREAAKGLAEGKP